MTPREALDRRLIFRYNDMNAYIQSRSQAQCEERCARSVHCDVRALCFLLRDGIRSLSCDVTLITESLATENEYTHTNLAKKNALTSVDFDVGRERVH